MAKNCWEFKSGGREVGGNKVTELGVCPAATATEADGFCGGKNGGRGCAFIAGTYCGGIIQGTVADKKKNCIQCEFYMELRKLYGTEHSVSGFGNYVRGQRVKI